jgi:hypothetical protein
VTENDDHLIETRGDGMGNDVTHQRSVSQLKELLRRAHASGGAGGKNDARYKGIGHMTSWHCDRSARVGC